MKFYPVYYFTLACPTIERTLEKIDQYVKKCNILGIQIDMPSRDPYGETDLVKAMMANCIEAYNGNYDLFMDRIRSIRAKHPSLEIHVVVYPDVVESIGIEKFTDFCKDIGAFTVRIAGTETFDEYISYLNSHRVITSDCINYSMPEEDIVRCQSVTGIIHMRTKRKTEAPNRGLETWKQRLEFVRSKGVKARVFATADMKTAQDLVNAREAGADGVYVGNVLMNLWDDEESLWKLLAQMQSTIVK
ncbi:MAG: tryptophan synthase subunit alpha [Sphaerochaetaceae bacterium]|nr:tryptophan synthase subunit alpha [Sphaerochaetaceae bacterium]